MISTTGVILASFADSMVAFIVYYGCINAIGCGMQYLVPLVVAYEYFPEKKGFVTGLIMGAYGMGSFIFNPLSSYLVNPKGKAGSIKEGDIAYFKPEIANRVRKLVVYISDSHDAISFSCYLGSIDLTLCYNDKETINV